MFEFYVPKWSACSFAEPLRTTPAFIHLNTMLLAPFVDKGTGTVRTVFSYATLFSFSSCIFQNLTTGLIVL